MVTAAQNVTPDTPPSSLSRGPTWRQEEGRSEAVLCDRDPADAGRHEPALHHHTGQWHLIHEALSLVTLVH